MYKIFLFLIFVVLLSFASSETEPKSCSVTTNEEGVCRDATPKQCPSQTDLAIEMARLSSPKALLKLKHILSSRPAFEIDLGGTQKVFDTVALNMKTALEGFGLEPVDQPQEQSTPSTMLRLETFFSDNRKAKDIVSKSIFFLQTEQICCSRYGQLGLPYLEHCHLSPHCLIWEYSQTNWEFLNQHGLGDSVLLVPFLLQQRLDEFYYKHYPPSSIPRLEQRPMDVVFFGVLTERRKQIQQQLQAVIEYNNLNWNILLEEVENSGSQLEYMADKYIHSKTCLILHGFGEKTPGEYHRLSELATSGCLPVVETFGDTVGIETYSTCGGVIFADLTHIASVIHTVLETIAKGESFRIYERLDWWRQRVQWDQLLELIVQDAVEQI